MDGGPPGEAAAAREAARRQAVAENAALEIARRCSGGARLLAVVADDAAEAEGVAEAAWGALDAASGGRLSPAWLSPRGGGSGAIDGDAVIEAAAAALRLRESGGRDMAGRLRARLTHLAAHGEGVAVLVDVCRLRGRAGRLEALATHLARLAHMHSPDRSAGGELEPAAIRAWAGARVVAIGPEALAEALSAAGRASGRREATEVLRLPQASASAAARRAILEPWPEPPADPWSESAPERRLGAEGLGRRAAAARPAGGLDGETGR